MGFISQTSYRRYWRHQLEGRSRLQVITNTTISKAKYHLIVALKGRKKKSNSLNAPPIHAKTQRVMMQYSIRNQNPTEPTKKAK